MFLIPDTYWQVRKTKHKGKGIFAKRDIEPGVVVGDYLGTVVKPDEEIKLEKKHGFYTMYYRENASIFPDLKKPGLHLFNHSCTPSCWMYTYKGHTLYFTVRKVFKGEELTISYLLGPQDKACSPCADACKCESITCTNTQHITQKKYDAWAAFDAIQTKKTKAEHTKIGEQLQRLTNYPATIPDAAIYTLFGSEKKSSLLCTDKTLPSKKEMRKRIRMSGKTLEFPHLKLVVLGIDNNLVVASPIN